MTEVKTNKQELESAVAALSEYGFSKALIRRTLKDILWVYNGNDGWPLIKENGYEVVIERLISDNGRQRRKLQKKGSMQTCGLSEHAKEEQPRVLDPAVGDGGGLDSGHPVAADMIKGSSIPVTPTLDGHTVTDICRDGAFFGEDIENFDIHKHQRQSWTGGGLFPIPPWLRKLNVSEKSVPQKFSYLPALLKSLEKDSTKQAGDLANHCISSLELKIVKDEQIEYVRERFDKGHANSCKGKVIKNLQMECIGKHAEERRFSAEISSKSLLESKPALVKLVKHSHIQHAESCHTTNLCSQQESNSEIIKDHKQAEALYTLAAETYSTSAMHPRQDSTLKVLKAQEVVDVLLIQHDTKCAVLDPVGIKEREGATRKSRKRGFMPQEACEILSEPLIAARSKRSRTESGTVKANNLQSTLEAAERLDIARMSAFKLTRRRDGGLNPMFSRLQKLKHAGAGSSVSQHKDQQEMSVSNQNQCGEILSDSRTDAMLSENLPHTSDLPPGNWDSSVQNPTTYMSQPPSTSEREDQSPVQKSPSLPPGFEEPFGSPPESPRLPPGFWKPCGGQTLQERSLDGRDEDSRDSISSDVSPRLPPGFSEQYDPFGSPALPPGNWDPPDIDCDQGSEDCNSEEGALSPLSPELPPGFWRSPDRTGGLSSPSAKWVFRKSVSISPEISPKAHQEGMGCVGDSPKSKGIPPKQVFIANIPSGLEGAEQKLYSLVREILGGFKSVPISATLPRRVQVSEDHAFVEFCCEAMAGIFMDAYHANASVLRIEGEQLLAARSLPLMKADIQLRRAIAERLMGEALDPCEVFYLGNVPTKWLNEKKLLSHISILLEGEHTLTSKSLSVYTIPQFPDVYVHISCSLLAETFFLRCLSDKEHLEKISASVFVCRNLSFLPRAARLNLG